VELDSVVWSEGPSVISLTYLHDLVRHAREKLSHAPNDVYAVYDVATFVCLVASALRRYVADHRDELDSSRQLRVASALHDIEREMHWLKLCGSGANQIELTAAVAPALASAEQATALLRTDVSGVFMTATETERSIAADGIYSGFAR